MPECVYRFTDDKTAKTARFAAHLVCDDVTMETERNIRMVVGLVEPATIIFTHIWQVTLPVRGTQHLFSLVVNRLYYS